jgi:16S rRNA (guanine527-N7)-methyltransferase
VIESTFRARLLHRLGSTHISLSSKQIELLERYWNLLERWNSRMNLTALPLRDYPEQSLDRLIVEPLAAASLMRAAPAFWYDFGSGGGSPAIPLKIMNPAQPLMMVESRSRKTAFLREVVRTLEIKTAEVIAARFEDVAAERPGTASCVTARAVRADEALSDAARRLLRPDGTLILFTPATQLTDVHGFEARSIVVTPDQSTAVRAFVPRGTKS